MMYPRRRCVAVVPFELLESRIQFSFVPDPLFGGMGHVRTDFNHAADAAFAVALSGGKTLVAGASDGDFALARYNADGSLDATFGVGGKVVTDFGSSSDEAYAIAVQPDGRIVLAGQTQTAAGFFDFALARYTATGQLDSSFGVGGKTVVSFGPGFDQATAVAVQPDGRILVAGSAASMYSDFAVARLNSEGALDSTFGTGGQVRTAFDNADSGAAAMALQSDGRIVLGGYVYDYSAAGIDAAVIRYNADGSVDTSFGASGKAVIDFGGTDDAGRALAIQSDGRIVLAGYARAADTDTSDFAAARLTSAGVLDATFGSAGVARIDLGGSQDQAYAMSLTATGKIVLVGRADSADGTDLAVLRLTTAGQVDEDFAAGGKLTLDAGAPDDAATGVAIAADGSITVVGSGWFDEIDRDFVIARFAVPLPPPPPAPTNIAPTPSLTGPALAVRSFSVLFAGLFTDDDMAGAHDVSWDFGDGASTSYAPTSAEALAPHHTFSKSGVYTVTLRVRDAQGAVGRATFSVTVSATGLTTDTLTGKTTLSVVGTTGGDSIKVRLDKKSGKIEVLVGGKSQGLFQADKLILQGGQGRDEINVDDKVTTPVEIWGGDGRDHLSAGGGNATIFGGGGNDIIEGGQRSNYLDGGDGHDLLTVPANNKFAATLLGGAGNDMLLGGAGDDLLQGGEGRDHLNGRKGADLLQGDAGRDFYVADQSDTVTDPDLVSTKMQKK